MKRNQTYTSKEVIEGLMNLTEEKNMFLTYPQTQKILLHFLMNLTHQLVPCRIFPLEEFTLANGASKVQ